ncbi:hypothetical protein MASR1M66_23240 [Aminivibrio sp.]
MHKVATQITFHKDDDVDFYSERIMGFELAGDGGPHLQVGERPSSASWTKSTACIPVKLSPRHLRGRQSSS